MSKKTNHFLLAVALTAIGIVIIFNSFDLGVNTYIWFWNEASDNQDFYHPYTIGFFVYMAIGLVITNAGMKIFVNWLFHKY
ncbi:hypothetical protein [Alkalihalobacillus sp. R86527]|uniref:hypothetical protein n=1 Tax=Alkalihalobacillus sp. R86527 TaxID=3093863 RepID=UPI00366C801D